jgi:hypothetical protein
VPDQEAARLALAIVWSAVIESPHAFDPPRFVWDEAMEPAGAIAASEHLASLPKPVTVSASRNDSDVVRLEVVCREHDAVHPARVKWLAEWMRELNGRRALVLSGGRALRVGVGTLERLGADYRLSVPSSGGGGTPGDPWTQGLELPSSWLIDVDAVFLLGSHSGMDSCMPMRRGGQWDEALLEDLSATREHQAPGGPPTGGPD